MTFLTWLWQARCVINQKTLFISNKQCFLIYYTSGLPYMAPQNERKIAYTVAEIQALLYS